MHMYGWKFVCGWLPPVEVTAVPAMSDVGSSLMYANPDVVLARTSITGRGR